jgi:spore coat protein U-like protein
LTWRKRVVRIAHVISPKRFDEQVPQNPLQGTVCSKKGKSMKVKFNQSKIKLAVVSAVVAGSMGLSAAGYAATASDNMAVSTTVTMSCTISAGELQFPGYDPTSESAVDATATLTTTCTAGGAAVITLAQGANTGDGSTDAAPIRRMIGAGGNLAYDLYSDSDRTTVWGNTTGTGSSFTSSGSSDTATVYGRIPALQAVGAGSFADSVAVTLTY